MLNKLLLFLSIFLIFSGSLLAQWTYEGVFPPANPDTVTGQAHAMAVDPDGKVWVSNFTADDTLDDGTSVRSIRVYNPDGTHAAFSPIKIYNNLFVSDTLIGGNGRGMRADHEGNILYVSATPYKMYRFNYLTGEGMNLIELGTTPFGATSPTAPAVDAAGNIFLAPVVPGTAMVIFDKDFNYIGNAIDATIGFSRSFEVSADGNTIYWAGYTNGEVYVYTRPDIFSGFDSTSTILQGFHSESMTWNPGDGTLYLSAGSYNDLPEFGYTPGTWYSYDVTADALVDSFTWQFMVPQSNAERPRSLGFSPDGKIAYAGVFGGAGLPLVQKFVNATVDVKEVIGDPVADFNLEQNFPNPFNPTTTITFSIPEAANVSLKVYDMIGQEVATLINSEMSAGKFTVQFDAGNLASGTYVYELRAGSNVITNKMMLMK